ncbi:MAG: hydroxymethylbilane synthase [Eubacteriales bacterium]|nr:hydroxymethylbilane synthase [Eubacteriales bacterium]
MRREELPEVLRIGTRGSALALAQTKLFTDRLRALCPSVCWEIVTIRTEGDRHPEQPLREFGGRGVFVTAIEDALRERRIDCAVHSAKDMAASLPDDMEIACVLPREDPADVLVTRGGAELSALSVPGGAAEPSALRREPVAGEQAVTGEGAQEQGNGRIVIGTGSPRRKAQLCALFPEAVIAPVRGNLPTRLDKLRSGSFDALVLAAAGLRRIGLDQEPDLCYRVFTPQEMVPAGGQGIIAVETGRQTFPFLRQLGDRMAGEELETERLLLRLLEAGCHEAIGVRAQLQENGEEIRIDLMKELPDGIYRRSGRAPAAGGRELAQRMAEELLTYQREQNGKAQIRRQ